jgi:acyl-CoA dehydrogenase
VQFPLARVHAELVFDAGKECGADANMAASEATWHAAAATSSAYGGFASAKEYDIERKWREARLYQAAPISSNLILAYIGQHVLGMPRSY